MAKEQSVTLSVVESDAPTFVRMFNSSGCDIGVWPVDQWRDAIASEDIILQIGDTFRFEE